ncbi:MAG: hypothetical protein AAFU67_13310, partial [Bacteroidota bacterium]
YGREVDDFHTVDYEAIAMLNVSATQEQEREIQSQKAQIEALQKQVLAYEAETNSLRREQQLMWQHLARLEENLKEKKVR